jgi:DNA modification methylase
MDTIDTIITGNCLDVLPTIPAGSVPLAYFDPPFGIGMDYPAYDDRRPDFGLIESTLRELARALSPSGSLWVQCGQTIQAEVCVMLKRLGLHWRNTVPWHYTFGECQSGNRKFTPSWQALHWFTVHPKRFTFNVDAIRIPSARQTTHKDKRANPNGKVPDDVWFHRPQEAEAEGFFDPAGDVWHVPRVPGTAKGRKDHCCQTADLVCERIIRACSNPGDLVLDPMCGTGTAPVAAKLWGRRWLGIEKCEATAERARRRLANVTPPLFV